MRDYMFRDDLGREIPVAQMTTADIAQCLAEGVELEPGDPATWRGVMERLQLELEIRALGLRG